MHLNISIKLNQKPMSNQNTIYLLRTLCFKPKGLRVRFKIERVNGSLITFDEAETPAATIMLHGLFLARPTANGEKHPLLLGVLNQEILQNEEPQSEFGVTWVARAEEINQLDQAVPHQTIEESTTLGKRTLLTATSNAGDRRQPQLTHKVTVTCHGVSKELPCSDSFREQFASYLEENQSTYRNLEFECRTSPRLPTSVAVVGGNPGEGLTWIPDVPNNTTGLGYTRLFASFMQAVLDLSSFLGELKAKRILLRAHGIKDGSGSKSDLAARKEEFRVGFRRVTNMGPIFVALCSPLRYFKLFIKPTSPDDSAAYDFFVRQGQKSLLELSTAMLNLLVYPFIETLAEFPTLNTVNCQVTHHEASEASESAKILLEMLVKLAQTPFEDIPSQSLEETKLPYSGSFDESRFSIPMYEFLITPEFGIKFFFKVKAVLDTYSPELKSLPEPLKIMANHPCKNSASAGPHQFVQLGITQDSRRISDQILATIPDYQTCAITSTYGNQPFRFCSGLKTRRDWSLLATFSILGTQICFLLEEKFDKYQIDPQIEDYNKRAVKITHVQIFRQGNYTTSFILDENNLLAEQRCAVSTLRYFTGRYFVILQNNSHIIQPSLIMIMDLAPCLDDKPAPPTFHQQSLESIPVMGKSYFIHSQTDKFLALMRTDRQSDGYSNRPLDKPATLNLVSFGGPDGFKIHDAIDVSHNFDQIANKIRSAILYQNAATNGQLSWFKDRSRVYYTNWNHKDVRETQVLFIACFELAGTLDSLKTITYSRFPLEDLLEDPSIYNSHYRPSFSVLHTKVKDYLVMDVKNDLDWDYDIAKQSNIIFQRLLFTLHNKKLHWVYVNDQLIQFIPKHIGTQIQYPGYNCSPISLFHQRRVYCANKVVSAIFRLDYKPR